MRKLIVTLLVLFSVGIAYAVPSLPPPPIRALDCSAYIIEGQMCWDTDGDKLYIGNGVAAAEIGGAAGSTTFVGLTDTPANYTGAGGYFVKVNVGGTAVEFVAASVATHLFLDSTIHTDTLTGTVLAGDTIIGNATPAWSRLAAGTAGQSFMMGATLPQWGTLGVVGGGTGKANVTANSYLKGTGTAALTERTYSEVKTDLSLNNVENTALTTWTGTATISTVGTLTSGSLGSGFTAVAVARGGTGGADAATARTNLGVAIGSNVQAWDADLDYLATFTPTADVKTVLNAANNAAILTALSLTVGTNVQAYDTDLSYLAGFTPTADVKTVLNCADASAIRTALALRPGTEVQAYSATLASLAGLTETNGGIPYGTADNAYAWLAAGTTGKYLRGAGASAPTWSVPTFADSYPVGSILAANTAETLTAITWSSSGTKVLTNATGVISWEDASAPGAHTLNGASHTVTGLTAGQVLWATAATTFDFSTWTFPAPGAANGVLVSDATNWTRANLLSVPAGGTGLATVTANSYLKGNGTSALVPRTYAEVKTDLSLNNVENTALSTWAGTSYITGVGALASGSLAAGFTPVTVALGGTNSSTALNNNRIMRSSGGAIGEALAITAARVLISDENGIPTHSTVTSATLGHLDATSSIQTQINAKSNTASPTFTGTVTVPTLNLTNSLTVAYGGTGRATSTTAYGLLAAGTTATGAHQTLAAGLTTQVLVGGGTGALPAWGTNLPTAVTIGSAYIYRAAGTDVSVADGGTNKSSWTQYAIPYASTTGVISEITIGTAGQYLKVNSGGTGYDFGTPSGAGDLKADGTVPLTANWNVGLYTITAAGFTAAKASGIAGDIGFYEANSYDTDAAGFRGPASLSANTSFRGQFPNARPGTDNSVLAWAGMAVSGAGTPSSPYIHAMSFIIPLQLTGGTMTGKIVTATPSTSPAGLNIPHGTEPSSLANGDIWTTTSGLYARINGSTVGPFISAGSLISDTAYDKDSWDGVTGVGASKNAIRDYLESLAPSGLVTNAANVAMLNESTDTTCFPAFLTDSTPGNFPLKTVSTLTFNSNTGLLSATGLGGTLSTAAQPNITSVGTLTSLAVTGAVTAANYTSTGADGTNRIVITNNTAIAPTAATMEIYPEGNVWKMNTNGVESTILNSSTGQPLHASLTSIAGLTETNGGMLYGTADNTYAWLVAGAEGTLLMGNGAGAPSFLAAGTSGYMLVAAGAADPVWTAPTGTDAPVKANSPTFTDDITIAAAGVKLTGANGSLTILGLGDGQDEDVKIDLNTTANTIIVSSPASSATTVSLSALNLVTTGTIQGGIVIDSDADGKDGAAMSAVGMYGTLFMATGAGTWILPTAVAGMSACLMDSGTAHDLILDCQAGDDIQLKGTEQANGVGITNAAGTSTGDFVCVVAISAGHWVTMGMGGTWASQ